MKYFFSLFLVLFVVAAFGQAPPVLRQYYTTNADPVLSASSSNAVFSIGTNAAFSVQKWNVKAYGASGSANIAADSLGLKLASSNAFRFGGIVYFPAGHYLVTNIIACPGISTNGFVLGQFSDISLQGENLGSTIVDVAVTNNTFWSTPRHHRIANITFRDVNTATSTNYGYVVYDTSVPEAFENVRFDGFYVGARMPAVAGQGFNDCIFDNCGVGLWIPRYTDGAAIKGARVTFNKYAGIFIGGTFTNYPGGIGSSGIQVQYTGQRNLYDVAICSGTGIEVSGMSEGVTNAGIAAGVPPGFMGETNVGMRDIKAASVINSLTANGQAAVFEVNSPEVGTLICENSSSDYFMKSSNSTVNTSTKLTIVGGNVSKASVLFSDGTKIPSIPGSTLTLNWEDRAFYFASTTNNSFTVTSSGARVRGFFQGNTESTISTMTLLPSPSGDSWRLFGGSVLGTANQDQIFRIGMVARDGGNTPQTLLNLVINGSSAGAHHINMGGGTSIGKPFSAIDWYFSDTPTTAHAGTNAASLDSTSLDLKGNVRLNVGPASIRSGQNSPEGAVTANVGSIFMRTNGGVDSAVYVKTNGTGNTGWMAVKWPDGGATATSVNYGDSNPAITPGNGSSEEFQIFAPNGDSVVQVAADGGEFFTDIGTATGGSLNLYVGPVTAPTLQTLFSDGTSTDIGGASQIALRVGDAISGDAVFIGSASGTTVRDTAGATTIDLDGDTIDTAAPSGLIVPRLGADPSSPTEGAIWYRTDTHALRIRVNGANATVTVVPDT